MRFFQYFGKQAIKTANAACKLLLFLGCFTCVIMARTGYAEEESVEYKIKAGYLYNFTKCITWQENASATFNLCLLGDDPFGSLIDPIEQRTASDRPIKLIRMAKSFSKDPHCHILFIGASVSLPKPIPPNVLTVSEQQDFALKGGVIGFINKDGRIKLQINLEAVKQSGLKISAKLLEVAEIIAETKQ